MIDLFQQEIFVFDVESIGIHGDSYAVAGALFDKGGVREGTEFLYAIDQSMASGRLEDHRWVRDNIPAFVPTHTTGFAMRQAFIQQMHKHLSALIAGECVWPVEANFLSLCAKDDPVVDGPYPLIDICSIMLAAGMDPMKNYNRLPNELPKHNPLADVRQSGRLLFEALRKLHEIKNH